MRLNAELVRIVQTLVFRAQLHNTGVEVVAMTPQETTLFIARDRARWAKVVQQYGNSIEGAG